MEIVEETSKSIPQIEKAILYSFISKTYTLAGNFFITFQITAKKLNYTNLVKSKEHSITIYVYQNYIVIRFFLKKNDNM